MTTMTSNLSREEWLKRHDEVRKKQGLSEGEANQFMVENYGFIKKRGADSNEVSQSLDDRSAGFLSGLKPSRWWSTDPEDQKNQLFPAKRSDGMPLKSRGQIWGYEPINRKPGPGHKDYKGPIENVEQRPKVLSMEEQTEAIENRDFKTQRQKDLEAEQKVALGGVRPPMSLEEAEKQVAMDKAQRNTELASLYRDETPDAVKPAVAPEKKDVQPAPTVEPQKEEKKIAQQVVKINEQINNSGVRAQGKQATAQAKEKMGRYYVDPVSGYALNLDRLDKAINRKKSMELAALLPPASRAAFLASDSGGNVIDKADIPVDPEVELKKRYYEIQIATASLKLENEKKKMSPEEAKYFDIAKTAISSQNYYLAATMLEKAGVKDINIEEIIKNDGKFKASLLKKNGMSKGMEDLTGFKPEKISSMRSNILKDWRTQDNPVSGEASKRSLLLKTYGLPDSEGEGAPDFTQMVDMGNGKKMSQFKASLLSRAADPTQAPVYAQQLAFAASKIPDDTSRWTPEDYEAWLTDSIVYLEMHQRVKNYDQYLRAEAGVVANENGKVLSGTKSKEETVEKPKPKPKPDPDPEPKPDMSVADEAIDTAAKVGLMSKGIKRATIEDAEKIAEEQAKNTNVSKDKLLESKYKSGESKVKRAIEEEIKEANDPTYRANQIKGIGSSRANLAGRDPRWTDIKSYVKWLKDNNEFDDLGDDVKYYLSQIE